MESVLSEAGQGALSAERGYVSYDAEPGFQEFPLEGALAEERESLQSDENHEDPEDRMRSIEEELERLAMDEDEEEESEETQLLDTELSSGDRADELEGGSVVRRG